MSTFVAFSSCRCFMFTEHSLLWTRMSVTSFGLQFPVPSSLRLFSSPGSLLIMPIPTWPLPSNKTSSCSSSRMGRDANSLPAEYLWRHLARFRFSDKSMFSPQTSENLGSVSEIFYTILIIFIYVYFSLYLSK